MKTDWDSLPKELVRLLYEYENAAFGCGQSKESATYDTPYLNMLTARYHLYDYLAEHFPRAGQSGTGTTET